MFRATSHSVYCIHKPLSLLYPEKSDTLVRAFFSHAFTLWRRIRVSKGFLSHASIRLERRSRTRRKRESARRVPTAWLGDRRETWSGRLVLNHRQSWSDITRNNAGRKEKLDPPTKQQTRVRRKYHWSLRWRSAKLKQRLYPRSSV